jgi:hypothetical protein
MPRVIHIGRQIYAVSSDPSPSRSVLGSLVLVSTLSNQEKPVFLAE